PDDPPMQDPTETSDIATAVASDGLTASSPATSPDLQPAIDTSITPTLPTTYSAQLHLDPPIVRLAPPTINLTQPETSKWGVINVILGGVFFLGAAGQLLHEHHDALS